MNKKADIVIIGGGISGAAIAYNLAKKGMKNIIVVEKRFIASGATGACGAGIRQQWGTEMNCKIAKMSCEFFETANEVLEYDGDIEFKQGGYLLLATTEKEKEQFRRNIKLQNSLGIESRELTLDEAKEIVPILNTDGYVSAAYYEKDGHLNPFHTTLAFAKAAEKLGVEFMKYTEVTDIVVENGQVTCVVTDKGLIETNQVVNAAGGHSQDIARMVGVDLPIYSERHQILVTEPIDPILSTMVMSFTGNFYCQQVPHGGLVMGRGDAGEPRDGNINSGWHFLDEMAKTITDLLPPLKKAMVIRQWAGLYNITPDRQPILGPVHEVKGFYLAVGFSGHGFMFGPATGILMAEMIMGEETSIDISALNLYRFEKGELVFEPSVV
ncbi:FAD-binding oxidoreductase [Acidaminobacter sp. JC074]|uniref:NAD(P)/FAD-dependent oxidoreductase n=1 Tax=Acidaminobacter sp. JC074 TaxID=2530199 RepID=UPI001F10C958|nr:FAD-binding oxidoreductase [Acidaminobacter sp. JC074]MCH4889910.1 FAD-binding oxidoreductase [Acidaminobacter sp. JC074]